MSEEKAEPTGEYKYWQKEIEAAIKRFQSFHKEGDETIDVYRQQKSDHSNIGTKDKYNILYSSTETMRPNLYAQRPKVRIKIRQIDTANPVVRLASRILENTLEYLIEEQDFDDTMDCAVEDLILPGLGQVWVRYEPKFGNIMGDDGKPLIGDDKQPMQELIDETVIAEYVYWQDFLTGSTRNYRGVPWVGRRVYRTKNEVTARFGPKMAAQLSYTTKKTGEDENGSYSDVACFYEVWDKRSKKVYWVSLEASILLDVRPDPLRLKNFFPCPRPMRAISNNRTVVPKSYYSQYKSQHDTLNTLTARIRLLGEALRVVGVYDASFPALANMLNPSGGNKMIAVDSWAQFAQSGGIKGQVEFLPIEQVVATLIQLQAARETCKNEIYEITGFSDIVRGVSKASETLGAQNLKANWASARIKRIQKDVQRFARDVIAIIGEVVAEHCSPETILRFSGIDIPDPQAVQSDPQAQQKFMQIQEALKLLASDASRVSKIDIETDSTLLPDQEAERKDRTDFLAAAGAFLQQSVPAMEKTPELGPLLGAMLMFVVRTFPTSRPIEEEFEKVQQVLANNAQQPKANPDAAKTQAATGVAQIRAQSEQARVASDQQVAFKEIEAKQADNQAKLAFEQQAENNRHTEKMAEISFKAREVAVREREVTVKEAELGIKQQDADTREAAVEVSATTADMAHEREYDKMDREDQREEESTDLTGDPD